MTASSDNPTTGSIKVAVRAWFRPPRAHGEIIEDRTVSFLELFYDLVFVVLVAQISHTLAGHVNWTGVRDFVVVFALIWIAWANGSLYHELHGGEDGRSRTYIFAQMTVLVLLAVYAGHAADDVTDGRGFAVVYAILLVVLMWQWLDVRRQDHPEMRPVATTYVAGLATLAAIMVASAFVDDVDVRVAMWAGAIVAFVVVVLATSARSRAVMDNALRVTESMAERFGLFTIVVLGEVVVGAVDGISDADRTARTITTGILALGIGFSVWWTYFDFVGRRQPRAESRQQSAWLYTHLPLHLSIAAGGAGMVSLIEHAADERTPAGTAWLVSVAFAITALSIAGLASTLPEHPARRLVPVGLTISAVVVLALGALRPPPWLLAIGIAVALSAVWGHAFVRHARHGVPLAEG